MRFCLLFYTLHPSPWFYNCARGRACTLLLTPVYRISPNRRLKSPPSSPPLLLLFPSRTLSHATGTAAATGYTNGESSICRLYLYTLLTRPTGYSTIKSGMRKIERLWAEIKEKMAGGKDEQIEGAQRAQHLGKSLLR